MQITRNPGESCEEFAARAFRFNRLLGSLEGEPGVYLNGHLATITPPRTNYREACDCNQGRQPCTCRSASPLPVAKGARKIKGATRLPVMSRLRAIWYGAGLFAAGALVATAVFGMGQ